MTKIRKKLRNNPLFDESREAFFREGKIDWIPTVVLLSTPFLALVLVPWYGLTYGFSASSWVVFGLFLAWSGLGITAGYHRLWSHRTYKAVLPVRFMLLVGATFAIQSSVFDWCSGHRKHHQHVDDIYQDPYSAKRGFWFSHIGWMLKDHPSSRYDYKNIADLTADPMLRMQHDHYHIWVAVTSFGLPILAGWLIGDIWGTFILAGLLRLVISHHVTFFINSLAHIWGTQPYTDENTARDNPVLAFVTWGEGYHNYHHIFQYDYRNGVKWWQYDPTKWLIAGLAKLGLAYELKRVPAIDIKKAQITMKFKTAKERIAVYGHDMNDDFQQFKTRVQDEYDAFTQTLDNWRELKKQAMEEKISLRKQQLTQKIAEVDQHMKHELTLIEQRMHEHGKQLELAVERFKGQVKSAS